MTDYTTQIKDFNKAHADEMLQFLEEIVQIESGPGLLDGIHQIYDRIQDLVKSWSDSIHFERISQEIGPDVLVIQWNNHSDAPYITLSGHVDTVFAAGSSQSLPYREIDEKIYGAGVYDMKNGVVMALYILKALIDLQYSAHPIQLIFCGDEEVAHRGAQTPQIMSDYLKGSAFMLNFEPSAPNDTIITGRKGGNTAIMDIEGIAAHSGQDVRTGRSAITEAAHKILQLDQATNIDEGRLFNTGLIQGGHSENTIAPNCQLTITYRYETNEMRAEMEETLRQVTATNYIDGTKSTVSNLNSGFSAMEETSANRELFDHLQQVADATGYGTLTAAFGQGASDASIASPIGVPVLDGVAAKGNHAHTDHEYIEKQSYFDRLQLLTTFILQYGK